MSDFTDILSMSDFTDRFPMLADRPVDWANIVRDRRRERGLSQADLAERIGMSRQWVSGFERGRADKTPLSVALTMIAILDLEVELMRAADD